MPPPSLVSTGLAITNPLIAYRALLATKVIDPDPAQHRLAIHLQKLYFRLKDYSPSNDYASRLEAITRAVGNVGPTKTEDERTVAVPGHPLRRNPLFAHLFSKKQERDTLSLTRVLTSHEAAMKMDSPQGLLLHGEVGTGKSFLVDILADSLPNKKKRRWHFNTFMLETLARLEQLRESRLNSLTCGDAEHSLIWLAKDMIENSPILFLDEFQLPDRAASKILSNLFTTFFQLGGVLVATSNRMPDELAKASGMDFTAPSRGWIVRNLLGLGSQTKMDMFPSNNEYAGFVDVLKSRCEIWNMEGGRDWRRREVEEMNAEAEAMAETMREEMIGDLKGWEENLQESISVAFGLPGTDDQFKNSSTTTPKKYNISSDPDEAWEATILSAFPSGVANPIPWKSTILQVYGRRVPVPRHLEGVTYWSFDALCGGAFGPADYITLASTFHTVILDNIPILTFLQKNEARRLITLLDALYEARCKLLIRAEAGPDDLFFPETKRPATASGVSGNNGDANDGGDAVYPETLSEIYQDQTSPFRPNVSSLEGRMGYDPDEDTDFGPAPGKGNDIGRTVDFGTTSSFTGEDERFAYKRARSRLWEVCGSRWHARSELGWWRPLPLEVRRWERSRSDPVVAKLLDSAKGDVQLGPSIELDRPAGLQGKEIEEREKVMQSPFREKRDPPTKIGLAHAWGMVKWGKEAGPWGQGPQGLEERKKGGGQN